MVKKINFLLFVLSIVGLHYAGVMLILDCMTYIIPIPALLLSVDYFLYRLVKKE